MQKTSLWQRLHAAFFPPETIPVKPQAIVLKQWKQTEDEFFAYLSDRNFIASIEVDGEPNKQRAVLYTDGDTGEVFAMAVRWPNRYYYYTFEH